MVTFEINSNEANALQIEETQVLQANRLQKNCQESNLSGRVELNASYFFKHYRFLNSLLI